MARKQRKDLKKFSDQEKLLCRFAKAAGCTHAQIAKILNTSKGALHREMAEELEEGGALLNARIVGALFASAMKGSVAAQIFWCKTRLGWRETDRLEVTGADGKPIEYVDRPTDLTPAQWEEYWKKEQAKVALDITPDKVNGAANSALIHKALTGSNNGEN